MSDAAFDAIELNLQLTDDQRACVMERLRQAGWVNSDGTVSQHYWIKFSREELAKAAEPVIPAGSPAPPR